MSPMLVVVLNVELTVQLVNLLLEKIILNMVTVMHVIPQPILHPTVSVELAQQAVKMSPMEVVLWLALVPLVYPLNI